MNHEESSIQTILLDIFQQLGGIQKTLGDIKRLEEKLEKLDSKISLVADRTSKLELFEGRVGAYIWLGGSIASGVLFMLWEGIKFGIDKFNGAH